MRVVVIGATGNVSTSVPESLETEPAPKRRPPTNTLADPIEAMRRGADYPTPPLARETGGPARIQKLVTGLGGRP
jgi:hypothetical protein